MSRGIFWHGFVQEWLLVREAFGSICRGEIDHVEDFPSREERHVERAFAFGAPRVFRVVRSFVVRLLRRTTEFRCALIEDGAR